jgi:hypothetical protein
MLERCGNPKNKRFKDYGARGIVVCERWKVFADFLSDIGRKPSRDHSIERVDNDKGYAPDNAIWATNREQTRNTRRNVLLEYNGATMCLNDWASKVGINRVTIAYRLKRGWTIEKALTIPPS